MGIELLNIIAIIAAVITAIAAFALKLDHIFSFWNKYIKKDERHLSKQTLTALRQKLLQTMKEDTAERLEQSLHNLIRIDLAQEEQRHQVGKRRLSNATQQLLAQPSQRLVERELAISKTNGQRETIPSAEQTYNVFHRADINQHLLILGEPGSGKTTELLTVAQQLVEEAITNHSKPIPLIFELSSWKPNTPVFTWLEQQLQQSYGVSKKLVKPLIQKWIQQTRILLLLDGLDELEHHNQVECIKALEVFFEEQPAIPALVCCRREEYERSEMQLTQLNGAVYLKALESKQIQQYLQRLGKGQLWREIQAKPQLLKLAKSPLFLAMLSITNQDKPLKDTASLLNIYIKKQLHDPNHQGIYKPGTETSPTQMLHYLRWLAQHLEKRKETEFFIEHLQPDCLGNNYGAYILINVSIVILLSLCFVVGIQMKLDYEELSWWPWLVMGGVLLDFIPHIRNIKLQEEEITYDIRQGLVLGIVLCLLFTIFAMLIGVIGLFIPMLLLIPGLNFLPYIGLYFGLRSGINKSKIQQKTVPNQGIRKSLHNGLINIPIDMLIFGLIFGLLGALLGSSWFQPLVGGMAFGIFLGIVGGISGGLGTAFKHFILRICLTKKGDSPWNYAKFLNHATRHRFMQRTGGRYRFIHDLLRQHFAQMTPEQQALLASHNNTETQKRILVKSR